MREIPPLRTLCLRAVGPPGCQPEITFGGLRPREIKDVENSEGGATDATDSNNEKNGEDNEDELENYAAPPSPPDEPTITSRLLRSLRDLDRPIQPYTSGISRANANDVDISQPWVMAIYPPREEDTNNNNNCNAPMMKGGDDDNNNNNNIEFLAIENGNHAVECLQMFIDALVESGRAGDSRIGVHFFREWVQAVTGQDAISIVADQEEQQQKQQQQQQRPKKRQKGSKSNNNSSASRPNYDHLPLGSLSLHNLASASINTFRSMQLANVGSCLGTLDLTGVHGLTDTILSKVICADGSFPRLQRLSLKNCRKLTGKSIASIVQLYNLQALDVGGCFNLHPNDVIEMVQQHPGTKRGTFTEVYASGLGWTDVALEELMDVTSKHIRGLGVGFSPYLSGPGLILALNKTAGSMDRLSIPFCTGVDDAVVSALGKNLPKLAVLDIRGCNKVYSLTGMMDGRIAASNASAMVDDVAQHLFVLARYSGISDKAVEETKKLYCNEQGDPMFECILDGGGTGGGVRR